MPLTKSQDLPHSVRLHLISAPWAGVKTPSIQVGALKAYVDRAFDRKIETFPYSAFFSIPTYADPEMLWPRFFVKFERRRELPYFLLFHKNFSFQSKGKLKKDSWLTTALERYANKPYPDQERIRTKDLYALETATNNYVDSVIAPNLTPDGINVVGFTLNFNQTHASLYIEKYLEKHYPNYPFLFVYGGHGASSPSGVQLLRDLKASGVFVIGEGETKLEKILKRVIEEPKIQASDLKLTEFGVVKVSDSAGTFFPKKPLAKTQLQGLNPLPLPDYNEYFEIRDKAAEKDPVIKALAPRRIVVEGSRGCFAKCDFCAHGGTFTGFRKLTGEQVFENTRKQCEKYQAKIVTFTDNVCDPWAAKYAELIVDSGIPIASFMEHRAHFPFEHWKKLSQGGVRWIQLGVEAYSSPLLRKIGKGTTVIQNLVAQKCLQELGIHSLSNLITRHPKSTIEDVQETRRILSATPHFPQLSLSPFHLNIFSPLYEGLSSEEKAKLKLVPETRFTGRLRGIAHQYFFEMPRELKTSSEVTRAWLKFEKEFEKKTKQWKRRPPKMTVRPLKDGRLVISDQRGPRKKTSYLSGNQKIIFDACHAGLKADVLATRLQWPLSRVESNLKKLVRRNLVLQVDTHFLSLALRELDHPDLSN